MRFDKDKLVELQSQRSINNHRLSKAIGVHPSTIQNWREGRTPLMHHLVALCKYFDVPMDELLKSEE